MSMVPWRYDNPYNSQEDDSEERRPLRWFCLAGRHLAVCQDFASPIGLAEGNTGHRLWSAGFLLAAMIDRGGIAAPELRGDLVGRRILELGAGCGLPSLVCACRGGQVTSTDAASALPHLRRTLAANVSYDKADGAPTRAIEVAELDWASPSEELLLRRDWHAVIGADLLFDPEASVHLAESTLWPLMRARPGVVCAIVYKRRGLPGEAVFFDRLAGAAGWLDWRLEEVQPLPEFRDPSQHSLLLIRAKSFLPGV